MWHALSLIFTLTGLVCFAMFIVEHFNDKIRNRTRWSELSTYQWILAAGIVIGLPVGVIVVPLISYFTK